MNVIFDLGGVVVRWEPEAFLAEVYPESGVREKIRSGLVLHDDWHALDRGTLTAEAAVGRVSERTGLPADTVLRFLDYVPGAVTPIPETIELLRDLKRAGHTLYCLSNMGHATIDHLERQHDFWDAFDGGVISCRVRKLKPEPAIYEHLLAEYGLEAGAAVFLDDAPRNVEGARRVGLRAILFEDATQGRRELARLGCAATS